MFKPQPFITVLGKRITSFTFFGILGFVVSLCITYSLVIFLRLSVYIWLFQVLVAVLAFFSLAKLMVLIKDTPTLVYYHHEIVIIFLTWIYLLLVDRENLLQYLDITVIGLGFFLVFGRIGCFMAGCCHGKPACFGVHYHGEHISVGFPYYYLNAKLFPVQLIESAGVLLIVTFSTFSIISHKPQGTALTLYILCYGLLRFFLEFARGDLERVYYWKFSEAQWISVSISVMVIILAFIGYLPSFLWHKFILATWMTVILVFLFGERPKAIPWLQVKHYQIKKLAILISSLDFENNKVRKLHVGKNTILITGGIVNEKNSIFKYFTVSMYPVSQILWIKCVGRIIYALDGCRGDFTILNKNKCMMQFIINRH